MKLRRRCITMKTRKKALAFQAPVGSIKACEETSPQHAELAAKIKEMGYRTECELHKDHVKHLEETVLDARKLVLGSATNPPG